MNQESLEGIIESLEMFIELKRQNLLKKYDKLFGGFNQSRVNSNKYMLRQSQSSQLITYPKHNRFQGISHSNVSRPQREQSILQRFATLHQNQILKEQMFQTFNKHQQPRRVSTQMQNNYASKQSQEINQNNVDLYQDISDNDQFQDIVLDRLSKLQENINLMMRERKMKDQMRGYVGAPIQNSRSKRHYFQEQNSNSDNIFIQKSDGGHDKKYDEASFPDFSSWQTSPIKHGNPQAIYNMKYIPMLNKQEQKVNINKIKQLMENVNRQEQHDALNHQFFNANQSKNQPKPKPKAPNGSFDAFLAGRQRIRTQNLKKLNPKNDNSDAYKRINSSMLYLNRYGASHTTRNINPINQVHFSPKHIEMQTVIEPGIKYSRKSSSKNLNAGRNRDQNAMQEPRQLFKGKGQGVSGVSHSSENSNFQSHSWRENNKSSLY